MTDQLRSASLTMKSSPIEGTDKGVIDVGAHLHMLRAGGGLSIRALAEMN